MFVYRQSEKKSISYTKLRAIGLELRFTVSITTQKIYHSLHVSKLLIS